MPLPHWLATKNRRFTNHVLGRLPRRVSPFVILHHKGRFSGRPFATPLAGFSAGSGIILTPTYGPEADWVQNILSATSFQLDRRGSLATFTNAHLVDREAAWPYLPRLVRVAMQLLRIEWYVRADSA